MNWCKSRVMRQIMSFTKPFCLLFMEYFRRRFHGHEFTGIMEANALSVIKCDQICTSVFRSFLDIDNPVLFAKQIVNQI